MYAHDFLSAGHAEPVTICPNCGGDHYDDNRLDEALYREAAKEAPRLRFEGKDDEAIEVLTALCARQIANFIREQFRCLSCGVTFDA